MSSSLVQVQTLKGSGGMDAALAVVESAVAIYNKANSKATPHVVVDVTAVESNTKGMQWQLALLAVVARQNGVNMIRLNVHNGRVALCGPAKAIEATRVAMIKAHNDYSTLTSNSYNQERDGNRVGFTNGFLCGCPAGLQDGLKIQATLAYGIGSLFSFPAPGTGIAYNAGHKAALALVKPVAPRVSKERKLKTVAPVAAIAPVATELEAIAS